MILLLISVAAFAANASDLAVDLIGTGFDSLDADIAVGETIQVGNKFIIPLFEANSFFLGGGGGQPVLGAGGLGSLNLVPYAVLIISDDDFVVKPVTNQVPFLEQIVGIIPEILPLFMQYFTLESSSVESFKTEMHDVPLEIHETTAEDIKVNKVPLSEKAASEKSIESLKRILMGDPAEESFKGFKEEINELMKKEPENADAYALNGYITLRLLASASPLEQMKYAMEAQNSITKALAMDPKNYFANLANGWLNLYSPMGQMSSSVKGFKNAIDIKPEQSEAYFGIVEAYVKTGDITSAKEYAEKGKLIAPDSSEYFDELLNK
jgi:uncharacterized spore protein YtfJ